MPTLRDKLLQDARWYSRFKNVVRAERAMRVIVEDHVRPRPGERFLDVGCGNGDIRPFLGDVDYTGVDLNTDYLRVAKTREDAKTRFLHADVAELRPLGLGPFDCAIGIGLLHHLTDDECRSLFEAIHDALKPTGRFVTVDPVFTAEQRTTARVLAALDRGRHVREPQGYVRLFADRFSVVAETVRGDLLPFPYTHAIIEAVRL